MSVDPNQDDDDLFAAEVEGWRRHRALRAIRDEMGVISHNLARASANGSFWHDLSTACCSLRRYNLPDIAIPEGVRVDLLEAIGAAERHVDCMELLSCVELKQIADGFGALTAFVGYLAEDPEGRTRRHPDVIEDILGKVGILQFTAFNRSLLEEVAQRQAGKPDAKRDACCYRRISENIIEQQKLVDQIEARAKHRRETTIQSLKETSPKVSA